MFLIDFFLYKETCIRNDRVREGMAHKFSNRGDQFDFEFKGGANDDHLHDCQRLLEHSSATQYKY